MAKSVIAQTRRELAVGAVGDPVMALTDLLGEAALGFCHARADAVPGRYVIEIRQDGSLLSMRATAESWATCEEGVIAPSADVLGEMYEKIAPQAAAYFAECGELPPLAEDMFDLFAGLGFDVSIFERVVGQRVLQ